jgi:predicted ATPase
MLWGRSGELARIEQLLDVARRGQADAVAIHGEAGIGKTAILEYALERSADLRVLSTRGIESKIELPYSALMDILRPVLESDDAVVEPQASALRAALRLAPSERRPDPVAIYAGTLGASLLRPSDRHCSS